MTQDKADIATRLRQTRANMIGTDDEQHYWDCVEAAAEIELLEAAHKCSGSALAVIDGGFQNAVQEIERLRLTDAEREAVERAADLIDNKTCGDSSTLRGLLERMSGNAALSYSRQSPSTPPADPTPDECSVPTGCTEGGGK